MAVLLLSPSSGRAQFQGPITFSELQNRIESSGAKVVLINFWASWCAPCRKEIPGLMALREKYSRMELDIMGVSVDKSMDKAGKFADSMRINYPSFQADREIASKYQVSSIPKLAMYIDGKLVLNRAGYLPGNTLERLVDKGLAQ